MLVLKLQTDMTIKYEPDQQFQSNWEHETQEMEQQQIITKVISICFALSNISIII